MAAQLSATVYVKDPDTRQTVTLPAGTSPEPKYAALVTNPAAWVDGKLPRLPKPKAEDEPGDGGPSADGKAADSGDASDTSEGVDTAQPDEGDAKPAARKTAARKPAARKTAAD